MKILVTGSAGFIGYHLVKKLLERGDDVIGIDSINDYYDVNLKYGRLSELGIAKVDIEYNKQVLSSKYNNHNFIKLDLCDKENIFKLFKSEKFDKVCNLAAQAGVRYSIDNPQAYINSNIIGFFNILEACRYNSIEHLVYASSSSVYGQNKKIPFSTSDNVDHPVSLYAASKKSNELMAHTYSYLYGIPTTGLRFFTVYGPWGRPDMAYFKFTKKILSDEVIDIYNNGNMQRDLTYIDDVIEGLVRVIDNFKSQDNGNKTANKNMYKIYNIGNNNPINLMDFISIIEKILNKKAKKNFLPMQPGDVKTTYADIDDLIKDFEYKPDTDFSYGFRNFVDWYYKYYL